MSITEEIKKGRTKEGRKLKAVRCCYKHCSLKAVHLFQEKGGAFAFCDFHMEDINNRMLAEDMKVPMTFSINPSSVPYQTYKYILRESPALLEKIIFDDPKMKECNEYGCPFGDRRYRPYKHKKEDFVYEIE